MWEVTRELFSKHKSIISVYMKQLVEPTGICHTRNGAYVDLFITKTYTVAQFNNASGYCGAMCAPAQSMHCTWNALGCVQI